MKKITLYTLLVTISSAVSAQAGGDHAFEFLSLSPTARITAMGGIFMNVYDEDPALAFNNPALLNPSMHNRLSLNIANYISDISNGSAGYAYHVEKWKTTFNGGIQFMDYGDFVMSDEIGNVTGEFKASEHAFTLGAAREYTDRFYYGANFTFITSSLESYSSSGGAVTIAGAYHDTTSLFTASVLLKNAGTQFSNYNEGSKELLPFDIQAGLSKRFEHTPFLFSLVLHHLHEWDIRYDNPAENQQTTILIDTTQQIKEKKYIADKIFRHAIIGTEIYFGDIIRFNVAYNHMRRQELAISTRRGLSGFSFGAGVRIYRFNLNYGYSIYNVAGGSNHFSLGINLDEWFGKRM